MPDIVANLRIDQAWGSAQIMGALHVVNPAYYGGSGASIAHPITGHPDNELGFVIGGGVKVNAPMLGQGDYFQMQVNYTQGALRYIFQTPNSNWGFQDGESAGWGVVSDGVYGGSVAFPQDVELTTAWNVNAAYDHYWSPRWKTSLYGGYAAVTYNGAANNNLCVGSPTVAPTNGCDNDWQTWWVGTRTQWNVTKDFYMGVDVLYSKLESATIGTGTVNLQNGTFASRAMAPGGGVSPASDPDNWSFRFRVHRDFYP